MLHFLLSALTVVLSVDDNQKPPPAFPRQYSLKIWNPGSGGKSVNVSADMASFALMSKGAVAIAGDEKRFSAIFCNASGMFAYYSEMEGNCFYQQTTCDASGFRDSIDFLFDDTLTLMYQGIDPHALPEAAADGQPGHVTWMVRKSTCSDQYNIDHNVTVDGDGSLVGWSKGQAVVDPLSHACSVRYQERAITDFKPVSSVTHATAEAFVNSRIVSESLYCSSE
jgi:hypothetical protein